MRPDLTLIFDPADLWPDANACPDWPVVKGPVRQHFSRRDGENRLAVLALTLNRQMPVRPPTDEEVAAVRAEHFRAEGPVPPRFAEIGVNLIPSGALSRMDVAHAMVEAAHIRGWFRKMDAAAEREARESAEREARRKRFQAERSATTVETLEAELAGLAEAVARYEQRLADEQAFHRARDLRYRLDAARREVAAATAEAA